MGVKGRHTGWARSSDVYERGWVGSTVRSCLLLWDPLALYVCPSWIHGQGTKEAILLNDDNTITINTVTPRRQDTTKQPAVGAVKNDDRWETRTCIAANNSLDVI